MIRTAPVLRQRMTKVAGDGPKPSAWQSRKQAYGDLMGTNELKRKRNPGLVAGMQVADKGFFEACKMNHRWAHGGMIVGCDLPGCGE